MDLTAFLVQVLNGVQYGFLLFLVSSGLTLVFGIMGIINLAHGAFYMFGAYIVFWLNGVLGNFFLAILLGVPLMIVISLVIERFAISYLYERDHLCQVLLTYGLILILNEAQLLIWGSDFYSVPVPDLLSGGITLTENQDYPIYRLFISVVCLLLAGGMYLVIQKTRLGMIVRAGASNREMVEVLGINITRVFSIVFSVGAALAAFSGMIAAPVSSVFPGMGNGILIVSFVVVVIGGIGSIKGAFIGAMLIGLATTFGQVLLPNLASMVVYALMAGILVWRPQGLYGRTTSS